MKDKFYWFRLMNDAHDLLPECDHPERVIVQRTYKNGAQVVGPQCQVCGQFTAIKKSTVEDPNSLPRYSLQIKEERSQELREAGRRSLKGWWEVYAQYLNSDEWKSRRVQVMARCLGICEACNICDAVEVHHLTYDHVGCEPLFDLVGLCVGCHEGITDMDKEKSR